MLLSSDETLINNITNSAPDLFRVIKVLPKELFVRAYKIKSGMIEHS